MCCIKVGDKIKLHFYAEPFCICKKNWAKLEWNRQGPGKLLVQIIKKIIRIINLLPVLLVIQFLGTKSGGGGGGEKSGCQDQRD